MAGSGWTLEDLELSQPAPVTGHVKVRVRVRNVTTRQGMRQVLLYAERRLSSVQRLPRWPVGNALANAGPGSAVVVDIFIGARCFAHWDNGWTIEPGIFRIRAGFSADELTLTGMVYIGPPPLSNQSDLCS
ncbi:hypothetical protein [Sinomonas sp. G460-2]|uniref:hypothetical protein n=1 Tax=Sinomonas sp. G460-2 TaxID=3393464 RepID=UPI0039EE65E5